MTPYPPPVTPYPEPIAHITGASSVNLISLSAHSGITPLLMVALVVLVLVVLTGAVIVSLLKD